MFNIFISSKKLFPFSRIQITKSQFESRSLASIRHISSFFSDRKNGMKAAQLFFYDRRRWWLLKAIWQRWTSQIDAEGQRCSQPMHLAWTGKKEPDILWSKWIVHRDDQQFKCFRNITANFNLNLLACQPEGQIDFKFRDRFRSYKQKLQSNPGQ